MKVDVYKNLHEDCYSVKSRETDSYGTVTAHRDAVIVTDAEFVVQPAGRERVRETGHKNVHAFVRGEWVELDAGTPPTEPPFEGEPITYDPVEYDHFVHAETEQPVARASRVHCGPSGVTAAFVELRD